MKNEVELSINRVRYFHISMEEKIIHLKLKEHPELTVGELAEIMEELAKKYPDREIFLDGDEQAICSRKRKVE